MYLRKKEKYVTTAYDDCSCDGDGTDMKYAENHDYIRKYCSPSNEIERGNDAVGYWADDVFGISISEINVRMIPKRTLLKDQEISAQVAETELQVWHASSKDVRGR